LDPKKILKSIPTSPITQDKSPKAKNKSEKIDIESEEAHRQDNTESPEIVTEDNARERLSNSNLSLRHFYFETVSFIIKNNLPFSVTGEIMKFIKFLLKNHSPKSLSTFTMNRKHVSNIATFCIAPHFRQMYLDLLAKTPYSIAIDEGETKTGVQYLAINARFIPLETAIKTETKLLGLVEVKESQTGQDIYSMLSEFLFSGDEGAERKKNLVGTASDAAPNMISSRGAGACSRLMKDLPYVVNVHDLCHALNLALKESVAQFPQEYYKTVKSISNTFAKSPKQKAILKTIQLELRVTNNSVKVLQVKRFVKTRWSSFTDALGRILENL